MKIAYDNFYCMLCKRVFAVPHGETMVGAFSGTVCARCPYCDTISYFAEKEESK